MNKVAVIFGAGGIGSALIDEFESKGYDVAVADLHVSEEVKLTAAWFGEFDITDEHAVNEFIKDVIYRLHRIDAVVVNSGITRDGVLVKWPKGNDGKSDSSGGPKTMIGMTTKDFDAVMKVHVYGAFFVARAVMPYLMQSKGSLAFTSSIVARDGNLGQTNYTAAKCALEGMVRTIAKEVKRDGVRVNAVGPGFTDTPMIAKMNETPKGAQKLQELRDAGYIIQPKTIAEEFLRLAEGTETGTISYVDGGLKL